MRLPIARFRRAESGAAAVEFALLGTFALLLFAGGFDLVNMIGTRRDTDRASTLIAHVIATCPNSSCMSDTINTFMPRRANVLIRYPNAAIELYMIQNQSNAIRSCFGSTATTTLTDSKLIASAKNILRDDDVGSAVMLTTTYSSLMPKALLNYFNATGVTYSGRTVDVMGNIGAQC